MVSRTYIVIEIESRPVEYSRETTQRFYFTRIVSVVLFGKRLFTLFAEIHQQCFRGVEKCHVGHV
jgi:hypothetical protein